MAWRVWSIALSAVLVTVSSSGHGHGFLGLRRLRLLPDQIR
jgi:hypothetical protein